MSLRSAKSSLDPYGIYGTRTANRMRASQRRRQSQKFLLGIGFFCLLALALIYNSFRRDDVRYAQTFYETGVQLNALPVYAAWPPTSEAAMLLAGRDGQLLRFNLQQEIPAKRVLWRSDFPLHTPLVYEDKVFLPCEDGILTALSWRSGKLLWRVRFDSALSAQPVAYRIASVEGQLRPVVVAAADSGLVQAIEIGSGRPLWRVRLPASIGNGLSVVESNGRARIMVPLLGGSAMRGGVWCLDGASGQVRWRFPGDGRQEAVQFAAPVPDLAANRVFLANDLGVVYALNLTTGKYNPKQAQGWKTVLQAHEGQANGQAIVVRTTPLLLKNKEAAQTNNAVVLGDNGGTVRYISLRDGIERWRFTTQEPIISLSQVALPEQGELVLALNHSPMLFLLDAKTGEPVWRFSSDGENFAGALVQGQEIYAVTESGRVQRFDLSQLEVPNRN